MKRLHELFSTLMGGSLLALMASSLITVPLVAARALGYGWPLLDVAVGAVLGVVSVLFVGSALGASVTTALDRTAPDFPTSWPRWKRLLGCCGCWLQILALVLAIVAVLMFLSR